MMLRSALRLRCSTGTLAAWLPIIHKDSVYVAQDGTFSTRVFDGNYKLVLLNGNGPWVSSSDSIDVQVNGATTVNVPVTPYFIIDQSSITRTNDSTVTATISIKQVDTSMPLEAVNLYTGTTSIVDQNRNIASARSRLLI